jgi:hypothetical protein
MRYLGVRNWGQYQHYRNRHPVWVKLHVKVLENEDLRGLCPSSRLLALLVLAVAANRENRFPDDEGWLSVEVGMTRRACRRGLDDLVAITYLEPLARTAKSASKAASTIRTTPLARLLDTDIDIEKETPLPPFVNEPVENLMTLVTGSFGEVA